MAQSHRSSKHKAYYASLPKGVSDRKNRNVLKSSHGKFANVAELVKQQTKVESGRRYSRDTVAVQGTSPAI